MGEPHKITGYLVATDIDRAEDATRRIRHALVEQLCGDELEDAKRWIQVAGRLLFILDHDLDPALGNIRDVNEGRSRP